MGDKWCPWCGRQDPPVAGRYDGTTTDWLEDVDIASGCVADHPERMGGQHVGKPCSGVLVIHKTTGIAVRCNTERSQWGNREAALERLRRILRMLESEGQL